MPFTDESSCEWEAEGLDGLQARGERKIKLQLMFLSATERGSNPIHWMREVDETSSLPVLMYFLLLYSPLHQQHFWSISQREKVIPKLHATSWCIIFCLHDMRMKMYRHFLSRCRPYVFMLASEWQRVGLSNGSQCVCTHFFDTNTLIYLILILLPLSSSRESCCPFISTAWT